MAASEQLSPEEWQRLYGHILPIIRFEGFEWFSAERIWEMSGEKFDPNRPVVEREVGLMSRHKAREMLQKEGCSFLGARAWGEYLLRNPHAQENHPLIPLGFGVRPNGTPTDPCFSWRNGKPVVYLLNHGIGFNQFDPLFRYPVYPPPDK